mmetsp:Transcript_49314/g.81880  ORF Transcript_49314/g.81880 Transcript_49314/m.81880 type:complete len:236 (-) Transcript_49314:45-752(-)
MSRTPVDILVVGSSVAAGSVASTNKGWVALLANALAHKYAYSLVNEAQGGLNIEITREVLSFTLKRFQPRFVIIGLSLANEGLPWTSNAKQALQVSRNFEKGMKLMVSMVIANNAQPVLGSVYPFDEYRDFHVKELRRVHVAMIQWGWPVLNFLSALDDGHGHWRVGTAADAGHPNDAGHRAMFNAIDLSLFAPNVPAEQESRATGDVHVNSLCDENVQCQDQQELEDEPEFTIV